MKKLIILALVLVLLATFVASPVLADSKSKGAVKADLVCPSGYVAGWVIVNTNAARMVNYEIHVDFGPPAAGLTLPVIVDPGGAREPS